MVRFKHLKFLPLLGLVGLGGCLWLDEEDSYYMAREWSRFQDVRWQKTAAQVSGYDEMFPSPQKRWEAEDKRNCLRENGRNRSVTQNGVSDRLDFRQCAGVPYAYGAKAPGERMGNRPDPDNTY